MCNVRKLDFVQDSVSRVEMCIVAYIVLCLWLFCYASSVMAVPDSTLYHFVNRSVFYSMGY